MAVACEACLTLCSPSVRSCSPARIPSPLTPSAQYPAWVKSAAGGWWPAPKRWPVNTAVAAGVIGVVGYSLFSFSNAKMTTAKRLRGLE